MYKIVNVNKIASETIESKLCATCFGYVLVILMKDMRNIIISTIHSDCKFSIDLVEIMMNKKGTKYCLVKE